MQLQNEFKQFLAENPKWSLTKVAKKIGKSVATLSQWKSGKYAGDVSAINKSIEAFLEGQAQVGTIPREDFEFVETEIMRQIKKAAQMCEFGNQMRIMVGRSGIGKTTGLRKYVEQKSGVILVEAYQGITKKKFVEKLARAAGYAPSTSFAETLEDLFTNLKDSERLIIIDEAEHLPVAALDAVRRIHDFTNCGVLLIGVGRLLNLLSMNQKDYGYIYNRCGLPVRLPLISEDDCAKLVSTVMSCNGYAKDFHRACKGVARDLKTIVFESLRIAEESGIDAEKDHASFRTVIEKITANLNRREGKE
jgi:DNA transposition AAA+ family ATPase